MAFDFEAGDSVAIEVEVMDSGSTVLSFVRMLTIAIRDINEAPESQGEVAATDVMTGTQLSLELPAELIVDPDNDEWTMESFVGNQAIPLWLSFEPLVAVNLLGVTT